MERYGQRLLSPEWGAEGARLATMAAVCDPETISLLERLGLDASWRCLEVGAGGGSVAAWLAERVAHVTATDIDTRYLDGLNAPNLAILRHDVTSDPLPEQSFDLVHARFVLEHLRERENVLDRMVSWLAPGGLLVVEAFARLPAVSTPHPGFRDIMDALIKTLNLTIGTDTDWPWTFPAPLHERGLTGIGAAANIPITGGANASAQCWTLTLTQMRPRILELGLASADSLDRALDLLGDLAFFDFATATIACWGYRS
ncbi:class I SAM-dependent methyltransferase [Streptosporangiaceae bacterium NEAU-GS5]|nr:class I SAM-dependent methyltransferase [Streptosporangiaceae bacterium NEAU-GS5]